MRPADKIENVVKKMSFKAGPEMDKDLWAEASKAQNEFHKTILAPSQHHIGRIIMKSPLVKFAIAAVLIIACLIGLSLWRNWVMYCPGGRAGPHGTGQGRQVQMDLEDNRRGS